MQVMARRATVLLRNFRQLINYRVAHTTVWFVILSTLLCGDGRADQPGSVNHQVTGLFSPERVDDLRKTVASLHGIKLDKVDFKTAEAKFVYDVKELFPNAKSDQILQHMDQLLRHASNHTFGVKPICVTPRSKMEFIEIPVAGLDCKACCLAAYESVYRIDGVELATASFKDGLVTAWIHPQETSRTRLEEALKKKGVTVLNQRSQDGKQ